MEDITYISTVPADLLIKTLKERTKLSEVYIECNIIHAVESFNYSALKESILELKEHDIIATMSNNEFDVTGNGILELDIKISNGHVFKLFNSAEISLFTSTNNPIPIHDLVEVYSNDIDNELLKVRHHKVCIFSSIYGDMIYEFMTTVRPDTITNLKQGLDDPSIPLVFDLDDSGSPNHQWTEVHGNNKHTIRYIPSVYAGHNYMIHSLSDVSDPGIKVAFITREMRDLLCKKLIERA